MTFEADLNQRLLSRRRLVAAGGAFAVAGATLGLAACSSKSNNASPAANNAPAAASRAPGAAGTAVASAAGAPSATRAAAATPAPTRGGTLNVAQVTDLALATGHPFALLPQNNTLISALHEPLIRYRDKVQPEMVLADRFEFNADRTMVTVGIRQGATFHNGQPVTPEDVFFGIDVIINPAKHNITGSIQIVNFAKMITDMKKVDDRTMQFTLDQPRQNFADFFAQMLIVQASTFPNLITGKDVQGTGPYMWKSWSPGQGYSLVANKNWWGTKQFGGPYLDGIDVKIFADFDSIGLAFSAGSVDFSPVTGAVAKPFKSKNQTSTGHKVGVAYVGAVVTNPQLKDPRVRAALFLALDRARFVNEVNEGFGSVTSQPWPSSSPAFDPALEAPLMDVQKAKQLLQAAGFTQSAPLGLEYASPDQDAFAAVVKANWAAIGVNIDLKPGEGNAITAKGLSGQFTDFYISAHAFADLSPLTNFQQTFPYRIPNVLSKYDSPTYDDIIAQLTKLDPLSDAAKVQYKRFNQLWTTDDPWMFPMIPNLGNPGIYLVSPKTHGLDKNLLTISNQQDYGSVWKG